MAGRLWRAALASVIALTAAPDLLAQTRAWTIVPAIGLRGTYTDNVSLEASPTRSEFVTQIIPGISINGHGARFNATLNYTGAALFYSRSHEKDRLANTLSASGRLEAVQNFFFVDAQGNISQNYISPFAPRPTDITTVTNNRVETRTGSLSPYVRGQFIGGYTYELRNRNTWTTTNSDAVADIHSRVWSGSVASPIHYFGWAIDGSDTNIAYDDASGRPEQQSSIVRGRLFFQPDAAIRLSATSGREQNNYSLGGKTRSYHTYGYGALWKPTPRTSAGIEMEHRFFGISRLVEFSHRTRLSAWAASYSRNASTFQQELLRLAPGNTAALLDQIFLARFPDPVQRQAAVDQFLRSTGTPPFLANSLAFYTQQVFLQERLQGSVGILGVRNSVTFTAFRGRSTSLTNNFAALPADALLSAGNRLDQHGAGLNASHKLTPLTSLGASANRVFAGAEEPPGPTSRNDFLALSLNHTLSRKTTTFGGASYTKFAPTGLPTSQVRSVFAGLDHRF